jgi:hypothetical protein
MEESREPLILPLKKFKTLPLTLEKRVLALGLSGTGEPKEVVGAKL